MEEFISLLDGQRLVNKMERAEFRDALGGKYEVMSCPLTLEIFTKFVNAKKAEMRIGTQEFELKGYHLQAFRDLLKKNQP